MPNKITKEMMDQLFQDLEAYRESLPEKPEKGEPVVLSDEELSQYRERGRVIKHWRNGKISVIISYELKEKLENMLKE